jgi:hypothetical protein
MARGYGGWTSDRRDKVRNGWMHLGRGDTGSEYWSYTEAGVISDP